MYLEQMLRGRSGAAHKVEFSWYAISLKTGLAVDFETDSDEARGNDSIERPEQRLG
jgi:hypothetical protein